MQLRKNLRNSLIGVSLSLILVLSTGCEDGPLGYDQLGRGELNVSQLVISATEVETYSDQISLGNAETLIGGRDSLTEARILIQIDGLDTIDVYDSVKLTLYKFRPDTIDHQAVNFSIHPVEQEWEEAGCTWVLADAYTKWTEAGGVYDAETSLGEISFKDNMTEMMLDPDLVDVYAKGIILIPQDDGFSYLGSHDRSSYSPEVHGFIGDDTTTFTSIEDATILAPYQAPTSDTLLGAGYSWRTFIYFPLDSLPSEIDITSADIICDYQNYFSPLDTLEFVAYRLIDTYDGRFSELSSSIANNDLIYPDKDSIQLSFPNIVQFWSDEPDSNFGMVLTHYSLPSFPEYSQENSIYALGKLTGVPRLVITYTDIPPSRFDGEGQ